MTGRIAVLCPSRERAGRIGECVEAFYSTSSGMADLFVLVDEGDPQLGEYGRAMGGRGILLVGPDLRCCPKIQWGWELVKLAGMAAFIGDDTLARTPGWDRRMLEVADEMGGWALLHPEDGHVGERHCIHPFMTGNIPLALGVFAPSGFQHCFIDNYFDVLGRHACLHRYMPEVVFEHMHAAYGKAPHDHRYDFANRKDAWDAGERAFHEWMSQGGLQRDLEKIHLARTAK